MITQDQIPAVLHRPVYGSGGQKIGDARHVYFDDATGRPEWVTVKTGMFGGGESFIPVNDAVLAEGHLEVPYTKDKIKTAPNVDVDAGGHLSSREEHKLYDFYGMDWDEAWQQYAGRHADRQQAAAGQQAAPLVQETPGRQAPDRQAPKRPAQERQALRQQTAASEQKADPRLANAAMTRSEEEMQVSLERRESGRVRLRKYVVTEEQQQTVPVRHEEARLVREPITEENRGQALSGKEISEAEQEVILHEDRPVVETKVVPKERVRLTTEEHTEQQTVRGAVRKEQIKLERPDADGGKRGRNDS
jgi:uncharacterized protein (TIGR02271 family)